MSPWSRFVSRFVAPLLAIATLCVTSAAARSEEAAELFECEVCHLMSLKDFKSRRITTLIPQEEYPVLPTGEQDIVSTPKMCFSCHDGFVEDSREHWNGGHTGHRIGMEIPRGMTVPELEGKPEFPMNRDNRMYCGTCHSAHINEAEEAWKDVPPFMRASSEDGQLCQACHADKAAIAGSPHDKSSRRAKDYEKRGTCVYCHAPHGSDLPMMWARSRGSSVIPINQLCRDCHDDAPHPGEHPDTVTAWSQDARSGLRPNASASMPVFGEDGRAAHIGKIGCPTCHNLHAERADGRPEHLPGRFLRAAELVQPLCADCHGGESIFLYKFFHSDAAR